MALRLEKPSRCGLLLRTRRGQAPAEATASRFPGRRIALAAFAGACCAAAVFAADEPAGAPAKPASPQAAKSAVERPPEMDPLSQNGACYICHIPFIKEELAKMHLAEGISCAQCHGLSDKHANDENIGATKPDILYSRDKVDKSCQECHDAHDVPAKQVLARFAERKLSWSTPVICTDCHGAHKIERSAQTPAVLPPPPAPQPPSPKK